MPITVDEVKDFAERWCDTLRYGDAPASEREKFFLNEGSRIFIQETGASLTLKEHAEYHSQFSTQILHVGDFTVTPLYEAPERARALGSLYWEAHFPDESKEPLRCVVGEDWVVERAPSGEIKMVLWLNTMHHFLADSSVKAMGL